LKVWDVKTGLELRTLRGHTRPVEGVAVSADGRYVVSASQDKTLRMWDIEAGVQISTFTCDAAAHCCAFVADDLLIAGDSGGRVHLLRLEEVKSRI
jgi:WD40 repeat protein